MHENRQPWLIARLFDFSFEHFVSLSLIRIVYALLAVGGLVPLAFGVFVLFQIGQSHPEIMLLAMLLLLATPLIYLLYLFVIRLICETLIVLFSIAENIRVLNEVARPRPQAQGPEDAPAQPI